MRATVSIQQALLYPASTADEAAAAILSNDDVSVAARKGTALEVLGDAMDVRAQLTAAGDHSTGPRVMRPVKDSTGTLYFVDADSIAVEETDWLGDLLLLASLIGLAKGGL